MPDYLMYQIDHNIWRFQTPDNWRIKYYLDGLYPRFEDIPDQEQVAYLRRLIEGDFTVIFRIGFFSAGPQTGPVTARLVEDDGGGGDDGTAVGSIAYEFTGGQFELSTSWGTVITDSTGTFYDIKIVRSGSSINVYHKFNGVGPFILEPDTLNSFENLSFRMIFGSTDDTYLSNFDWADGCATSFCLHLDKRFFWRNET